MRRLILKSHSLCLTDMTSENENKAFFSALWLVLICTSNLSTKDPPNVSTDAEQPYSFRNLWRALWSSLRCSTALYRLSHELTLEKSLSGADPFQPLGTRVDQWKMGQCQHSQTCTLMHKCAESSFAGCCGHLHRMKPWNFDIRVLFERKKKKEYIVGSLDK